MTASAGRRLRGSVRATVLATAASGLVQAATMVVLARLLGPSDYGFFVVCLSISALSVAFFANALERAMVVHPDETALHGRTPVVVAFLLVLGAGTVAICAAIHGATGWPVDLRVLTIVLGAQAFSGLAIVPRAMLRRRLTFARMVVGEVCGQFVGSFAIAAILAWAGCGPFALASGFAATQAFVTTWVLTIAPRDRWRLHVPGMGDLMRTMAGLLKVVGLEALHGQLTPIVVASVLGSVALGFFNRVYTLVTFPIQLLVSSANRVMISALTEAGEPARRRRATERLMRMVSTVITPLGFGVAGSSSAFVAVVLGDRWLPAAGIVAPLCIAVVANMLGAVLATLAEANRNFDEKARVQATSTVLLVAALLLGGRWGLTGVALGVMAGSLAFLALYLRLTVRIVGCSIRDLLRWLAPSAIAGASCFGAAAATSRLLTGHTPLLILGAQIVMCGITALLVLSVLDRPILQDLSELAFGRKRDRRGFAAGTG